MLSRVLIGAVLVLTGLASFGASAQAFCGFYVAKADAELFNEASKVVIARHDGKTVGERGMGLRFLTLSPEVQKKLDEVYSGLDAAA